MATININNDYKLLLEAIALTTFDMVRETEKKENNKKTHTINGNTSTEVYFGPREDDGVYVTREGTDIFIFAYRGWKIFVDCARPEYWAIFDQCATNMEQVRNQARFRRYANSMGPCKFYISSRHVYIFRLIQDNEYVWCITRETRNRLAHSTNGNSFDKTKTQKQKPFNYNNTKSDFIAKKNNLKQYRMKLEVKQTHFVNKNFAEPTKETWLKLQQILRNLGCDLHTDKKHIKKCIEEKWKKYMALYCVAGNKISFDELINTKDSNFFLDSDFVYTCYINNPHFDANQMSPEDDDRDEYDKDPSYGRQYIPDPKNEEDKQGIKINDKMVSDAFYDLCLHRQASFKEVKSRYIELAKKNHPDKATDSDSLERFKKIQAAYEVICAHFDAIEKQREKTRSYDDEERKEEEPLNHKTDNINIEPDTGGDINVDFVSPPISKPFFVFVEDEIDEPQPSAPSPKTTFTQPNPQNNTQNPVPPQPPQSNNSTYSSNNNIPKTKPYYGSSFVSSIASFIVKGVDIGRKIKMGPVPHIVMDKDIGPTRSFDEGSERLIPKSFIECKKVMLKNESLNSIFHFVTPDMLSNMYDRELYFEEIDEIVRLPADYLSFGNSFWTGKEFSSVNHNLFRIATPKYASSLHLTLQEYNDLVLFGPNIICKIVQPTLVQQSMIARQERQTFKIIKMMKNMNYISSAFIFLKFMFGFLSPIRLVKHSYCYKVIKKVEMIKHPIKFIGFTFNRIKPEVKIYEKLVIGNGFNLSLNMGYSFNLMRKIVSKIGQKFETNFLLKHMTKAKQMIKNLPIDESFKGFILNPLSNCFLHYSIFFINIPIIFKEIVTLIRNPITCVLSPLIEESGRDLFSTISYSIIESYFSCSFITIPLHIINYIISKFDFKYNYHLSVGIHILFNIFSLKHNLHCASSLLTSFVMLSKEYIMSKCRRTLWDKYDKYKMIYKDIKTPNFLDSKQKKGVFDMKFDKKENNEQYQYIVGPHCGNYLPIAFAQSKNNEYQAIKSRVLKDTPEPIKETLDEFKKWVRRNYKRIFPYVSHTHIETMKFDQYLEKSNAKPSVKMKLKKQYLKFQQEGINYETKLTNQQLKNFTLRESFVKTENLNYRTPNGILDKDPRLIQGGKKEFVVLVGPWIASLQEAVKKDWHVDNFICFTSGVDSHKAATNVTQRGWWLEDDVSAWDASCGKELLSIECWLYKQFGAPKAVYDLIQKNINTRGITSRGFYYFRDGCRKSGDPYTSLGNSILNALIHLFIYCRYHKYGIKLAKKKLVMLVQGDDSLINLSVKDGINWKNEMLKFGFKSIGIYKNDMNKVEFCSSRIYEGSRGRIFGPIPGKVLGKFGVFCQPPLDLEPTEVLLGSVIGLQNSSKNVPMLCDFIDSTRIMLEKEKQQKQNKNNKLNISKRAIDYGSCDMRNHWKMSYTYDIGKNIETLSQVVDKYSYSSWMGNEILKEVKSVQISKPLPTIFEYIVDCDTSGPYVYPRSKC